MLPTTSQFIETAQVLDYSKKVTETQDLRSKVFSSAVNTAGGMEVEYFTGLAGYNPTSKDPDAENKAFALGFKIGNFGLGFTSGGNLPQTGERIDYNAFLLQAGTILRTNRFMCSLFFPVSINNTGIARSLIYACEEVQVNEQKIEAMPYRMNMRPTILAPYMRDFGGTITLKFRMYTVGGTSKKTGFSLNIGGIKLGSPEKTTGPVDIEPRKSLLAWQNQIVSFDGQYAGVNYYENYTNGSSIILSTLDTSSNVLKNVQFTEVYPLEIGGLNPSWEGRDVYMTQTVTFAFARILDGAYGMPFIPPDVLGDMKVKIDKSLPLPEKPVSIYE